MGNQRRFALIGRGFGSDTFDENVQDLIGALLIDSTEIDFTYTDATPSITAALKTTLPGNYLFSGNPKFTNATTALELESATPRMLFDESDGASDKRLVDLIYSGSVFSLRTRTDADGAGLTFFKMTRGTGTNVTSLIFSQNNGSQSVDFTLLSGVAFLQGSNGAGAISLSVINDNAAADSRGAISIASDAGSHEMAFSMYAAATSSPAVTGGPTGAHGLIRTFSTEPISFAVNGTERMRLSTTALTASLSAVFTNATTAIELASATPQLRWNETDAAADGRLWNATVDGGVLRFKIFNDALSVSEEFWSIGRSGTNVDGMTFQSDIIVFQGYSKFSGSTMEFNATAPLFLQVESAASADNKIWAIRIGSEQFRWQIWNDADSVETNWLTVDRTGTTVDEIQLDATTLDFNGNLDLSGTLDIGGNVRMLSGLNTVESSGNPEFQFYGTSGGADEKRWSFIAVPGSDTFALYAINDARGVFTPTMTFTRTGTTVDSIALAATTVLVDGVFEVNPTSGNALPKFSGTQMIMSLIAEGATTDETWWRAAVTNGGQWIWQTRTDANTTGADFMIVDRTGTVIDQIEFLAGTFKISGTGETLATFADDGACTFYHNNTARIATSATGVDVLAGLLLTVASASGGAGLNLPHGAAPSAPADGDIWTTTAGLFVRINGVTVGPLT